MKVSCFLCGGDHFPDPCPKMTGDEAAGQPIPSLQDLEEALKAERPDPDRKLCLREIEGVEVTADTYQIAQALANARDEAIQECANMARDTGQRYFDAVMNVPDVIMGKKTKATRSINTSGLTGDIVRAIDAMRAERGA